MTVLGWLPEVILLINIFLMMKVSVACAYPGSTILLLLFTLKSIKLPIILLVVICKLRRFTTLGKLHFDWELVEDRLTVKSLNRSLSFICLGILNVGKASRITRLVVLNNLNRTNRPKLTEFLPDFVFIGFPRQPRNIHIGIVETLIIGHIAHISGVVR